MTTRRHASLALAGLMAALSAPALAQTATITMSHDEPDGVIEPGETIRVKMRIAWSGAGGVQLAGFAGQIRHDVAGGEGTGVVSNRGGVLWPGGGLVHPGVVVGDDIVGIDVATTPGFFMGTVSPPWTNWLGFDAYTHDWTAPTTPGIYDIRFVAPAIRPHVLVYPTTNLPAFTQALTTYIPATITVTPAPAAGIALAALAIPRRRRTQP